MEQKLEEDNRRVEDRERESEERMKDHESKEIEELRLDFQRIKELEARASFQ